MIDILRKTLGERVQENVPLAPYSTFKLGGPARYFFIAKTSEDIVTAAKAAKAAGVKLFLLAGGSNLLINDDGVDGLVVKAENNVIEPRGATTVYAEGGAVWQDLIDFTRDHALTGMEWGAGIPGTVGGAVRGNAGAFGESSHQVIESVEAVNTETGKRVVMSNADCAFEYRESIFKRKPDLIILSALFALQPGDKDVIAKKMQENLEYRAKTQPCLPSAGCTFKNLIVDDEILAGIRKADPEHGEEKIRGGKIGAGWFIDRAGLKGYQLGGVKVSEEHANFIVKADEKTARTDHVLQLISYIKQQVRDQFGVQLQEEVQYMGF